jgi:hypothetical protein
MPTAPRPVGLAFNETGKRVRLPGCRDATMEASTTPKGHAMRKLLRSTRLTSYVLIAAAQISHILRDWLR